MTLETEETEKEKERIGNKDLDLKEEKNEFEILRRMAHEAIEALDPFRLKTFIGEIFGIHETMEMQQLALNQIEIQQNKKDIAELKTVLKRLSLIVSGALAISAAALGALKLDELIPTGQKIFAELLRLIFP